MNNEDRNKEGLYYLGEVSTNIIVHHYDYSFETPTTFFILRVILRRIGMEMSVVVVKFVFLKDCLYRLDDFFDSIKKLS